MTKVKQGERIQCPDCGKTVKVTVGFTIPRHRTERPFSAPTRDKPVCSASEVRLFGNSGCPECLGDGWVLNGPKKMLARCKCNPQKRTDIGH